MPGGTRESTDRIDRNSGMAGSAPLDPPSPPGGIPGATTGDPALAAWTHRRERAAGRGTWLQAEATVAGRLLVIGLAAAGVLWLVLQVQYVAAATVLALAQVAMLWPLARWLRARGVPPALAAVLCVLAYLAFFLGLLGFVVAQVAQAWSGLVTAAAGGISAAGDWFRETSLDVEDEALRRVVEQLESSAAGVVSGVGSAAAQGLNVVGNLATVLVIALFATLFALTSGDRLWQQFLGALRPEHRAPSDAAFRAGLRTAGAWFYASTATGLVDGALIGAGLWLLDVPLALPIGALTFVLAYVPLVGATLAGALAVAVAAFSGGWTTALWTVALVVGVQQLEGNVLSPLLLSRAMRFHPLVTLLLTTGAAAAFGLLGLFLAVPAVGVLAAAVQAWRAESRREAARTPAGTEDGAAPT
jgi:predicted PurR-regulated permease PerM